MTGLGNLIKRNTKMYFKNKGIFFTSLITPLILLVLYATFLANVYKDSFMSAMPEFIEIPEKLIDAMVGGQLFSSLLAVCTITVAFCSNMLMVQDKANGTKKDLCVTPVKKSTLALSYYISTFISTMIICLAAMIASLIYIYNIGWYMTVSDVAFVLLDVFLLAMLGTALSSIINHFLSSQGQISAVGSIVSSCYGFICGAYMPISSFGVGLQKVLSFLPFTYGTSLLRNHALRGVFEEMNSIGFPAEVVKGLKDSVDCNVYFFDNKVEISSMYIYLAGAIIALIGTYVVLNIFSKNKAK